MDSKHILKGTINSVVKNNVSILDTIGKSALHAISPDNFEYYMCSLELLDSNKNLRGMINFAVMPNNINETKTQIATISKTNKGIVTTFNSTFIPRDISIQGTFGRKLRFLAGKEVDNRKNILNGNFGINFSGGEQFLIKSGFGLIKMLQKIINTNYQLDENGKPYILIWRNYALNTNYIVEVLQDSYSQSLENNMIWYYNVEMKAVAPADSVKKESIKAFLNKISAGSVSDSINSVLSDVVRSSMQF